jgi:hypothetical protein
LKLINNISSLRTLNPTKVWYSVTFEYDGNRFDLIYESKILIDGEWIELEVFFTKVKSMLKDIIERIEMIEKKKM